MNSNKSINIIGNILMILSFAFIVNRIIKYKIDFHNLFSIQILVIMIISIILYSIVVLTLAKMFESLLRVFMGSEVIRGNTILIYCKSNLYKYLPGNIFHYIGRNQIAINNEITHHTVISATITEMLLLILAGIISSIAFAGQYATRWVFDNYTGNDFIIGSIIFLIIVYLAMITFQLNSSFKDNISKYINQIKQIRLIFFLKILITYIFTFILNGVMFIMILYSIGGNVSGSIILPIIGIYAFSWVIGFITPGAPAGLGIREAIISALLFANIEGKLVITSVLLYRMITILGDVLGFLIAYKTKEYNNR